MCTCDYLDVFLQTVVVSMSPQSRASIAAKYQVPVEEVRFECTYVHYVCSLNLTTYFIVHI